MESRKGKCTSSLDECLSQLEKTKDINDRAILLYQLGKLAKVHYRKNSREHKEFIEIFVKTVVNNKEQVGYDILSESTNPVYVPKGKEDILKYSFAWKENDDREVLRREKKVMEDMVGKLKRKAGQEQEFKEKGFFIPEPLDIIETDSKNGEYCLPMQLIYGKTLDKKIHQLKSKPNIVEECLERVVDFLAWIHANADLEKSEKEDFSKEIKKNREKNISNFFEKFRDQFEDSKKAEKAEHQVIENIESIVKDIYAQNNNITFYKDAQPKNWIITPNNSIDALDFEGGKAVQEYDLVCLLGPMPRSILSLKTKFKLIEKYGEFFSQYSGKRFRNPKESKAIYLNLSLERAAQVARTLPEDLSKKDLKFPNWSKFVLNYLFNAVGTLSSEGNIDIIEENDFYYSNPESYKELGEGLQFIRDFTIKKKVKKHHQ